VLNQTPKNTSYVLRFVRNKPFVVRSTQKRLFRSFEGLKKTLKNTPYVLRFVSNKPFVVRSTQKRFLGFVRCAKSNAQKYSVCFEVSLNNINRIQLI